MSALVKKRFNDLHVVIVDDEESVVSFYQAALTRLGCQVKGFFTVASAIEYLQKAEADLIFLDYVMKGESGKEVMDYLVEHKPQLAKKVIFSSGDTYSAGTREMIDKMGNLFLPKPCTLEEIVQAMEKTLAH